MTLSNKLLVMLAGILLVFSIAAAMTLLSLENSKQDAQIVNALGRQRMLTQAMAKSALGYSAGMAEYQAAKEIFKGTLAAMKNGGEYPADLKQSRFNGVPAIVDETAQRKILEIEASFASFTDTAEQFLQGAPGSDGAQLVLGEVLTRSNALRKLSNDLVEIYAAIANQNHANIFNTMLAMLIVVTLIVALAGYYSRFHVMVRLSQTVASLREIARGDGDLTRRLDASGKDELGQLATAFNEFTEKIHDLVSRVQQSGGQLAQASENLQSVADQASQGSVEQLRDIGQVAHSMEEMTTSVQEVSRNTWSAHESAQRVDEQAVNGREVVTRTVETIREMSTDIGQVSSVVNRLDHESADIGTVLDVIRGIAEQTNLLALNAAIEAARAGEQGRGFAVVADEVRTLASRTQSSTEDIQQMIEKLQQGTGEAVKVMIRNQEKMEQSVAVVNQADEALNEIVSSVAGIKDLSTQIASTSEQQSQVAAGISGNVSSINQSAEVTVNTMNDLTSNASELSGLATRMDKLVGQFKV
ncbi:MAG: HAMP domain-containing protein [Gammaproteobacteria bacterium]|nr:HAMP domain-containing protein [Gammaproteobacteria bacterium]